MQRVFLLNRYFFPDQSATSQMLTDVAFHLAAGGIETHVVTGQQLYEDPDARLPSEEKVRDVYVHRATAFVTFVAKSNRKTYMTHFVSSHIKIEVC
jgi:colanic acid biosynthesis glycosyl transferase WcaI